MSVVVHFGILSVVVCTVSQPTSAYIKAWRFTKNSNIIQNYPIVDRFLIFVTVFWTGRQHCLSTLTYTWLFFKKNITKKWTRHLRLIAQIFTKLLHNVCQINTLILMYCNARCKCNLWSVLILIEFSYTIVDHCLRNCIFIKLSQIVCLIDAHIL